MTFNTKTISTLALATALLGTASADLLNKSFELGTGFDSTSWTRFGNNYREAVNARTGTYCNKMFGNFTGGDNDSGVYQDFAIAPGESASVSGYGQNVSGDAMSGTNRAFIKIVYRDGANNELAGAQSAEITASTPFNTYQFLSASLGPAPAGTTYGSVYVLFHQDAGSFAGGAAWFDDLTLTGGSSLTTVSGNVNLQDFSGDKTTVAVKFEMTNSGGTVLDTKLVNLDASGNYTFITAASNPAFITAKPSHWLAQKKTFAATSNFSVKNADIDGDNSVTILDYSVLSDYFDYMADGATLLNQSFELGNTADATNWTRFGNTYREAINARTGTYSEKMFGNFTGGFNASGAYQDFALAPGESASLTGYAINVANDAMSGDNYAVLKLVYRDAANNDLAEAESAKITAATPTGVYQKLTCSLGAAPAGTTHGSAFVLFLQPETNPFAGGACFFDDVRQGNGIWETVGENGFAPRDADIDGDRAVTILDYSVLSDNFDMMGD